jgi:hypothetical protein
VRLRDAIRIAIPSFVKLLTDSDSSIRSAILRLLHELSGDGASPSDGIEKQLTQV